MSMEIERLKAENGHMKEQIQRSYQKGCCLCKERIEELEKENELLKEIKDCSRVDDIERIEELEGENKILVQAIYDHLCLLPTDEYKQPLMSVYEKTLEKGQNGA